MPGEKHCDRCRPPLKVVYASFEYKECWEVVFYDSGTQKRLPLQLRLHGAQKLNELGERGQCRTDLVAKRALEAGINVGLGGLFLKLTDEQYQKLLRR